MRHIVAVIRFGESQKVEKGCYFGFVVVEGFTPLLFCFGCFNARCDCCCWHPALVGRSGSADWDRAADRDL